MNGPSSIHLKQVSVWALYGSNTLKAIPDPFEVARFEDPTFFAAVTADPDPFLLHADRATAILNFLLVTNRETPPEPWLDNEIASLAQKRAKENRRNNIFLVTEGTLRLNNPDMKARRDFENYSACFDPFDIELIEDAFGLATQTALVGVELSLPKGSDRQIKRVGTARYLQESNDTKPIYSFFLHMGSARGTFASPFTPEIGSQSAQFTSTLFTEPTLARPIGLLTSSFKKDLDRLQAFIAAWSALEIFVNATFRKTYERAWFEIMESGAPASGRAVFERFKDVMHDKYRLADKFLIVASVLCPDAAEADADAFRRLKKTRDDLLHALNIPTTLPIENVQEILLKYLKLHLTTVP